MRQATYAIVLLRLSGLCLGGVAGSVLGFVGDSITQNDYSKDVQVFLATRYPGRDLWTC